MSPPLIPSTFSRVVVLVELDGVFFEGQLGDGLTIQALGYTPVTLGAIGAEPFRVLDVPAGDALLPVNTCVPLVKDLA